MVTVPLAVGASERHVGRFMPFLVQNMYAEVPAGSPNERALLCRPGLEPFTTAGSGPIRRVFQRSGLYGGDALTISGQSLYRVSASGAVSNFTGAIPGRDLVAMDAGPDADGNSEARIATGTAIYLASGTTVAAETFPDGAGVTDVMFIRGFWIAIREDTQQLYSRVPGDTSWDALTFTSAEYQPDKALGLARLGDTVLVFGETSMEPFALSGNATNPLVPLSGSAQDVGLRARPTIVNLADAVFAVGDDCAVYKFTPTKKVVSDPSLAEKIRKRPASDLRAWGFKIDQHAFYVLSLGDETQVYDDATGLWATATSKDFSYWRAHLGAELGGHVIAADALPTSGQLWRLDPDRTVDGASDEIECIATAFWPLEAGTAPCTNIILECARGAAPLQRPT